jgi:hypothetical protein
LFVHGRVPGTQAQCRRELRGCFLESAERLQHRAEIVARLDMIRRDLENVR